MHLNLCLCDELPAIETASRWVVVHHRSERWKSTNTGRLVTKSIVDSQLCEYVGRKDPPTPAPDLQGRQPYLLFPRIGEDPVPHAELRERLDEIAIVVPDGSWGQARKMASHHEWLKTLPTVGLPEGAHARWSLRQETADGGLTTADAVAWLLSALEGDAAGDAMEHILKVMVLRTLSTRGGPTEPPI